MYKWIIVTISCCLIIALWLGGAWYRRGHQDNRDLSIMERIREEAELSLGSIEVPQHFLERSPDYNSTWVAKISLSQHETLELEKELNMKQPYPLETRDGLSNSVSWWVADDTATPFQYMTSYNAPVLVVVLRKGNQTDVYIEWVSP